MPEVEKRADQAQRQADELAAIHSAPTPYHMSSGNEEAPDLREEGIQPIVVNPMAGALEGHHLGVPEVAGPAIPRGVRRPALVAVHEECRAGDPAPEVFEVRLCHI